MAEQLLGQSEPGQSEPGQSEPGQSEPGQSEPAGEKPDWRRDLKLLSDSGFLQAFVQGTGGRVVRQIEETLQGLVRQVLNQPKFCRLEASYRNLWFLIRHAEGREVDLEAESMEAAVAKFGSVDEWSSVVRPERRGGERRSGTSTGTTPGDRVRVFLLDISADELAQDLESIEHSHVHRLLFQNRFDMFISRDGRAVPREATVFPLAMLVLDFELALSVQKSTEISIRTLTSLARVSERVFCPLVVGAAPTIFGQRNFAEFSLIEKLDLIFEGPEYMVWRAFRESELSRMVAVALPRVLLRRPYQHEFLPSLGCYFDQRDSTWSHGQQLWGNASFTVAALFVRSFRKTNWFIDMSGVNRPLDTIPTRDDEPGSETRHLLEPLHGIVTGLPLPTFSTELPIASRHPPVETMISEVRESELSRLGFVGLYAGRLSGRVAVLSCPSLQNPGYSRQGTLTSLKLSAMFPYMVVVSRLAHMLREVCLQQIGTAGKSAADVEEIFSRWLYGFIGRGYESQFRQPLAEEGTEARVTEDPRDPGVFDCKILLCPHHRYTSGQMRLDLEPVELSMLIRPK